MKIPALIRWHRAGVVAVILSLSIGCDQLTKNIAQSRLMGLGRLSFAEDLFRLEYAENSGAFLSLGAALPTPVRDAIFTWGVGAVLGALLLIAVAKSGLRTGQVVAYSLVAGGGASNLGDRILRHGYVIDFMNLGIGPVRTGIFNVADLAIVVGVLALVLLPSGGHSAPDNERRSRIGLEKTP